MTPLLTATPSVPPTYNPNIAETFSWVPIEGAGRPLYAQAVYPISGSIPGLSIPTHDYVELIYTGSDITTIKYRVGGVSGTIVATLTLTYDTGNLVGIAKS